jgi:phosphatidylinositol glycan class B
MNVLSLTDPYIQTFILRLVTALLALFSIRIFTNSIRKMIRPEFWKIFIFLSYFLWFLPFVNVRFSSETWSGIMFLNALTLLLTSRERSYMFYLVGGFLGLSFLFRYQNAFLALGVFLWLIFIGRQKLLNLVKLAGAFTFIVLLGVGIDYWLYGKLTLSTWNYFYVNLVEDVASGFGTERWWNYFYSIFRFSFFPIGIPIILSLFIFIYKNPRSIFTWAILPFFIIHSIIPHKELRFLFPVINLVPLILVVAYQELNWNPDNWKKPGLLSMKFLAILLLFINCIGTLTVSRKPSDGGLMEISRYIRRNYGDEPIRLISYDHSNPYGPWKLMASYYEEKDLQDIRLEQLSDLSDSLFVENRVNLLSLKRQDVEKEFVQDFLNKYNIQKKTQAIPEWMEILMTLYGGFHVNEILGLYEIPPKQKQK